VVSLINNKNAEAQTQATIKALELAIGQFKADNGHIFVPAGYNVSSPVPVRLTLPKDLPADLKGTLFKYLDQKLLNSASKVKDGENVRYFVDGWGRPLIFRIPGKFNKTGYDLGSAGPDGKVGDSGTAIEALNKPADYVKFGKEDDITNFTRGDTDPSVSSSEPETFTKILE